MSVSAPSSTPSVQLGVRHRRVPASQRPSLQSLASRQARPTSQPRQLPPQSTSVSAPSFTPSKQLEARQRPSLHVPCAQSLDVTHSTHAPFPSQSLPVPHAEPTRDGRFSGAPAAHRSSVHGLPSSKTSATSSMTRRPPCPSHTTCRQSPATWWVAGVLSSTEAVVQDPPEQSATEQSSELAGQSAAVEHWVAASTPESGAPESSVSGPPCDAFEQAHEQSRTRTARGPRRGGVMMVEGGAGAEPAIVAPSVTPMRWKTNLGLAGSARRARM
jgi:hypothetical protein